MIRSRARGCLISIGFAALLSAQILSADDTPNTSESIAKGRTLFANLCAQCHGHDGRAQIDVVADATDLTDPSAYRNGSDPDSIVKSIRDGAGAGMPAWRSELKDTDIAHLRNFIQSLWPPAQRPPLSKP
jgi:cytochrome c oxidase cbb3-type subunit III